MIAQLLLLARTIRSPTPPVSSRIIAILASIVFWSFVYCSCYSCCFCNTNTITVYGFSIINNNNNNNNNNIGDKGELIGIWKIRFSDDVSFLPFTKYQNDNTMMRPKKRTMPFRSDPFDSSDVPTRTTAVPNEEQPGGDDDDDDDGDDQRSMMSKDTELLIKLNMDGTFRQCSEGYVEGCWMAGVWDIDKNNNNNNNIILLALDRQYYGPRYDILLRGQLILATKHQNQERNKDVSHNFNVTNQQQQQQQQEEDDEEIMQHQREPQGTKITEYVVGKKNIISGTVLTGKFMYPKNHPSFFDQPLIIVGTSSSSSSSNSDTTLGNGTFCMEQAISTNSILVLSSDQQQKRTSGNNQNKYNNNNNNATARTTTQQQPNDNNNNNNNIGNDNKLIFQPSDFYNRKFLLSIEPINLQSASSIRKDESDEDPNDIILNQAIDFRVFPIQFYSNNTFQAYGMNKILRGRYGIQPATHKYDPVSNVLHCNELWFQVSLFGAGRSAPGSVYSEGLGLSHEDQRLYVGEILQQNNLLYVSGTALFGSDLGTDARMEPVAKFLLTETTTKEEIQEVPARLSQQQASVDGNSNIKKYKNNDQDEIDSVFE